MDHISHHLNPESLKTKHTVDYSALGTQHERQASTEQRVLGCLLPESTKSRVATTEIPKRHRKIAGHIQGR